MPNERAQAPLEDKPEENTVQTEYADIETEETTPTDKIVTADINDPGVRALTTINGIFGYVKEYGPDKRPTGNKIWLSLTPYEIAPRLSDTSSFSPTLKYVSDSLSGVKKYEKSLTTESNLKQGMTVGNRLQASRVVTNFMTEVLNPRLDPRYGSKDNRIGQASRFLNSETGDEEDRSAFLHIVPDLDLSNGRIAIQYGIEEQKPSKDENGVPTRKIESIANAFVPVNFNFVHSKYTLTIKEFMLHSVSEQNREIYSLDKTFDGNVLRFFGSHPKIISLGGVLSNFDDDLIGLEKLIGEVSGNDETNQTVTWFGNQGNQTAVVSSKGSMRDVFLSYYNNFLKGTKAKDYGLKIYLYYNWRIIEGYLIDLNIQSNGQNDNYVMFSANMVVKNESSVYEQGVGLGKSVPFNYYSRRFGAYNTTSNTNANRFELDSIFTDDKMLYRKAFRDYAITKAIDTMKIGGDVIKSRDYPADVYMQLLYPDDPDYIMDSTSETIYKSSLGIKLEGNITKPELKSLINLYLYRLIIYAIKYNRVLSGGKVIRESNEKAILQYTNGATFFPFPNENSIGNWLTNEFEKKEGKYFSTLWDSYKDKSVNSFLESLAKSLTVDDRGYMLIGPTSKSIISYSDSAYKDFINYMLVTLKDLWIGTCSVRSFPGDVASVGSLSLAEIFTYINDILPFLEK